MPVVHVVSGGSLLSGMISDFVNLQHTVSVPMECLYAAGTRLVDLLVPRSAAAGCLLRLKLDAEGLLSARVCLRILAQTHPKSRVNVFQPGVANSKLGQLANGLLQQCEAI